MFHGVKADARQMSSRIPEAPGSELTKRLIIIVLFDILKK